MFSTLLIIRYVPWATRDVTVHPEPAVNRYKCETIQIGWDVKRIAIQLGVGVYENISEGELSVFRKA